MHTHQGLTKHHNIIVPCNYFGKQAVINYHHYNLVHNLNACLVEELTWNN